MGFLGVIRSHRQDETWSPSPWQSFFATCVGVHIPGPKEIPPSACGFRKFTCDVLGDHVNTCTAHSGDKKDHNWVVDQLADLFRTTHMVMTQQVSNRRGHRGGDIELVIYLSNTEGPVSLVMDLWIVHELWGSNSNPSLNGHLHYPTDIDRTLNEDVADKILQYRADYNTVIQESPSITHLCRIQVHTGIPNIFCLTTTTIMCILVGIGTRKTLEFAVIFLYYTTFMLSTCVEVLQSLIYAGFKSTQVPHTKKVCVTTTTIICVFGKK